ncbi:hypothetical protein KY285_010959 [Solanum tuberosum]|nr:hypothetical protein KY289_011532 [Solanum tuberosum]KAH0735252.1 hypothetical protein KY285_010959 [Solanum tuberosum]
MEETNIPLVTSITPSNAYFDDMNAIHDVKSFVKKFHYESKKLCLELWCFMSLILVAGYVEDAEIALDSTSICINILGWTFMLSIGFNVAISVRVSNKLGAGHPRKVKFSVLVVSITSLVIGTLSALVPILIRSQYPLFFTDNVKVQKMVYDFTPVLALVSSPLHQHAPIYTLW